MTRAHLPTPASPTDASPTTSGTNPTDVRDQPHRRPGLTPNQHAMFYHPMVEATQHTPI